MKKLYLLFGLLMLVSTIATVSAVNTDEYFLGTFEQGICMELYQQCANCTYVNLSSITYPNNTLLNLNVTMTKDGVDFNRTFCGTDDQGEYWYTVFGDKNGGFKTETIRFEVTPSGLKDNPAFYFLIFGFVFLILMFGFWIKDNWVIVLSGFGFIFVGLYSIFNGFAGIKDINYTIAISMIVIALGLYFSIRGALEALDA